MPTPQELVADLGERLATDRPGYDRYDAYYEARQPGALQFIAPEVRAQVGGRLAPVVVNWPRLAIGSLEERLKVNGFRLGGPTSAADERLWSWWLDNDLDHGSKLAHLDAMLYGRSYVSVWAGDDPATPSIRAESARQVAIAYEPGTRRRTAAVKVWRAGGYGRAVVFTPDEVTRLRTQGRVPDGGQVPPGQGWTVTDTVHNPLGVVPVVELRNRPRMLTGGESELVDVIPLTDAIAKLASDLMVSAEFHAQPRRWATGMELAEDADGNLSDPFDRQPGRTWMAEAPETRFGQFSEATLTGYVSGIELLTQQLASVTSIPAHYLNSLTGQLPSAESLRAAEASLVTKVRDKQAAFGSAWEEVVRLATAVVDGTFPQQRPRILWADPETRTAGQAADAALKRGELGVPFPQLMEDLGYTPEQIATMRSGRRSDALDGAGVTFDSLTA
jgi:hypothetical protein